MSTFRNAVDANGGDSAIEIVDVGSGNSGNGDDSDVEFVAHTKSRTPLKSKARLEK